MPLPLNAAVQNPMASCTASERDTTLIALMSWPLVITAGD